MKHRGSVTFFNESKGYGFIRDDEGREFFVHHSAIQADGFRTLNQGEMVEFEPIVGQRGRHAANVVKV